MDDTRAASARWYRQPVIWLAALILGASLAGCLLMIALASRNADAPLAAGREVLKMPLARSPDGRASQAEGTR